MLKNQTNNKAIFSFLVSIFLFTISICNLHAQVGPCDNTVPVFQVNLSGNPDSVWTQANVMRDGSCCGYNHPPRSCVKFIVTLDANAQGIIFNVTDGALPQNLEWQLMNPGQTECDPEVYPAGTPVCLNGQGPHVIVFCKPGGNGNTYSITSIPAPQISGDLFLDDGCTDTIKTSGFDVQTMQFNSIYPGTFGQYNNVLSCSTACAQAVITGQVGYPPYVDFQVCGAPVGSCYSTQLCDTVRVHFYPPLTIDINPQDPVICYGSTSTTVTAQAVGGMPPYSYLWSTGETTQTVTLGIGTYSVTISDGTNCPSFSEAFQVVYLAAPVSANAGPNQAVCSNNFPIALSGSIIGATGSIWSGGSGTFSPDATALNASYTPTPAEITNGYVDLILTTTGSGSCPGDADTVHITLNQFQASISAIVDVTCNGANDGFAFVAASSANAPIDYNWSNGIQTPGNNGLPGGTYTVTVTDATGCIDVDTAIISEPPAITATLTSTITACATADGTASVNASGGFPGYTYVWSDALSQTNSTATGLATGYYTVTVTDATSCFAIFGVAVDNEGPPYVAITDSAMVLCKGGNNGSATATITLAGVEPHTYLWSDPLHQTTPTATGLPAGTYIVIVTDALNCSGSDIVTITEPPAITTHTVPQHISCFGANDGVATVTASGGIAPYTFAWSNGDNTASINGLSPGTYRITVTDANLCTKIDSVKIIEPVAIIVNITNVNPVSCFGLSNGSATVAGLNGTPPYSFNWSSGHVTSTAGNLPASNYQVTVSDSSACSAIANIVITEPAQVNVSGTVSHVECFGQTTGIIDITVTGGTPQYLYGWSNGHITEDLYFVGAGNYTVTINDINGCSAGQSFTINQPNPITIYSNVANISCHGAGDGAINIFVSGGTPPYNYLWSNGANTEDLSGLSQGTYRLTVTDAELCTSVIVKVVLEPPALSSDITFTTDYNGYAVRCHGDTSGFINLIVTGGVLPYTFTWSNGANTIDLYNAGAGNYSVTVVDAHNCITTADTVLNEPPLMLAPIVVQNVLCHGDFTGGAEMNISGGVAPYSVLWSTTETTEDVNNLPAGVYYVEVTDQNLCVVNNAISITEPDELILTTTNDTLICKNTQAVIYTQCSGGITPYRYYWNDTLGLNVMTITPPNDTTFLVHVLDANNCSSDTVITTINTYPGVNLTVTTTNDSLCFGQSTQVYAVISGGYSTDYVLSYNNNPITSPYSITPNATQDWIFMAKDSCNVKAWDTLRIEVLPVPDISAIDFNNASCFGSLTGSIDITVSGGTPGYNYYWNNTATTEDLTNIPAGTYSVVVSDTFHCTTSDTIEISQPTQLNITSSNDTLVCKNSTVNLETEVNGGVPNYYYFWNGNIGTSTYSFSPTANTTVSIYAHDENNCYTDTISTVVSVVPQIGLVVTASTDSVCLGNSSIISIVPTGGYNGQFTLTLDNVPVVSPYTVTPNSTTTYTFTATDTCGLTATASITIEVLPVPSISPVSTTNIACNGMATGQINMLTSGGTLPYSFLWNNLANTEDLSNISAGTYHVLVTDKYNCFDRDTVTLIQPTAINLISSNDTLICKNSTITINAWASGGSPGYTYYWNGVSGVQNLQTSLNIDSTFNIYVSDANNCISDTVHTFVGIIPQIQMSATVSNDSVCIGTSTQIISQIFGPYNGSYTLLLDNQVVTSPHTVSPISTTTYILTAKDSCNLSAQASVTITALPVPNIHPASVTDILCHGFTTGSIDMTTTGGTLPYNYNWNNLSNTEDITGLAAGTYYVQVNDKYNCSDRDTVIISQPPALSITSSNDMMVCRNTQVSIQANASGGTGTFTYYWNNIPSVQSVLINAVSDTLFSIYAHDANNCFTDTISTLIAVVPQVGIVATAVNDSLCLGTPVQINISTTGLYAGAYTLTLDNLPVTTPFVDTPAVNETYIFIARDSCLLTSSDTVSITVLPLPSIALESATQVLCNGFSTGSIAMSTIGGTPGYAYFWNNLATTEDISNIPAGTYFVEVRDTFACVDRDTITITQPPPLIITTSNDTLICKNAIVSLITNITGGVPGYQYFWENQPGSQIYYIAPWVDTLISVYGRDANMCYTDTLNIMLSTVPAIQLTITTSDDSICYGDSVTISAFTTGPYNGAYSIYLQNQPVTMPVTVSPFGTTQYIFMAKDSCLINSYDTTKITVLPNPDLTAVINHVDCHNSTTGSIDITVSSGTPDYTFLWSTTANSEDIDSIPAGTYYVFIKDANQCAVTDTFVVLQPDQLMISSSPDTLICPGKQVIINAEVTGGISPYIYFWNGYPGMSVLTTSPTNDTIFYVYVKDINNCVSDSIMTKVFTYPKVSLSSFATSEAVCAGSPVQIHSMPGGGHGEIVLYNESGQVISTPYTVYPSNTQDYIIVAKDSCGTAASDTITINTLPVPVISIHADVYSGCNPLDVHFSGETNPQCENYLWNFGEQNAISFSEDPYYQYKDSGTYDVSLSVTTPDGCEQSLIIPDLITVYPKPEARFNFDPVAVSILNPGVSFINYSTEGTMSLWSFGDGATSSTLDPYHVYTSPGNYIVTLSVKSVEGCEDVTSQSIQVRDEFTFYAPTSFSPDHNNINENFSVFGYGFDVNSFTLYIYDRWGEIIFTTKKLIPSDNGGYFSEPWDGRVKGQSKIAPIDSYTWMVQYKDINGAFKQKSGPIVIIR